MFVRLLSLSVFAVAALTASPAQGQRAVRAKAAVTKPVRGEKTNSPTRYARARETVKLNRAFREKLRKTAENVGLTSVYHQVRDAGHREKWSTALTSATTPTARRDVLRKWIGAGSYPGLWTLSEKGGWYGQSVGGKPFSIKLQKGAHLYDVDNPKHQEVYKDWIAQQKVLHGEKIPNVFDKIHDSSGTPLSTKANILKAPIHERFYRDMKIAGVTHYDTYGRKCIILLNASAIADMRVSAN